MPKIHDHDSLRLIGEVFKYEDVGLSLSVFEGGDVGLAVRNGRCMLGTRWNG